MSNATANGKYTISKINIFAVDSSGHRVDYKSGREFGLVVVYSNGFIIERKGRFPSYYMAAAHAAKMMRVAAQMGAW